MLVVLLILPFTVTVFAANNVTFNVKAVKENTTPVSGAIFALECLMQARLQFTLLPFQTITEFPHLIFP